MVRLDLLEGIKPEMSSWYWERKDEIYSKLPKDYLDLVNLVPKEKFVGGYMKHTSAVGSLELQDLVDGGEIYEDRPTEGYPVYGTLKQKALSIKVPRTLDRDWFRTKDFLRDVVKNNWTEQLEVTKEKLVMNMYNYGGYIAGNAIYNNDDSGISLSTYTSPNLCYDGKPMFTRLGNERSAKSGTTYYNAVTVNGVTKENAQTMKNLLVSTNAKMENDQAFDNSRNLIVLCHKSLEDDWKIINNSTLNPDNAANAYNPLKGTFDKIIGNPYITTSTFSAIISGGKGIKAYFSEPYFNFWETQKKPELWASIIMDYAIWVANWRPFVSNNAPTS